MQRLSIAILALAPITLLTVIYPLHFLPVADGASPSIELNIFSMLRLLLSIKGFFLVMLSILTVGLLLLLAWYCKIHVSKYRRMARVIDDKYISLAWYSDLIEGYNPLVLDAEDPFEILRE